MRAIYDQPPRLPPAVAMYQNATAQNEKFNSGSRRVILQSPAIELNIFYNLICLCRLNITIIHDCVQAHRNGQSDGSYIVKLSEIISLYLQWQRKGNVIGIGPPITAIYDNTIADVPVASIKV